MSPRDVRERKQILLVLFVAAFFFGTFVCIHFGRPFWKERGTKQKKIFKTVSPRNTNLPLKKQTTTFFLSSATPCGACFHPSEKYTRRANASGIRVAVVRVVVVARCGVEFIHALSHFFPLGVLVALFHF